jgi:pimeloyl-ACP methyl ester carboxylesterase
MISFVNAQPYAIGKSVVTFKDSSRNNRNIETEIYYPATQAGNNVPLAGSADIKFPVISFGHGFVMTVDAYANIRNILVPEGYIVALTKTEGSLAPSHANFGKDLAFVIDAITRLNQNSNSIFLNRVDSMNCVMGHSMGGGAAHLAAAENKKIKTVVTFAAAETNPSAIAAARQLLIPALVFAGGNDCVTPPSEHQLPIYNALKRDCKTYLSIIGGSHCYMAENNTPCSFGESTCTPAPNISRAEQHAVIKSYLLLWLKYQLKKDCNAGKDFEAQMKNDPAITYQNSCTFCVTSDALNHEIESPLIVYPNPFNRFITVNHTGNNTELILMGLDGRNYFRQKFMQQGNNAAPYKINTADLPKGLYLLKIKNDLSYSTYKLIKTN